MTDDSPASALIALRTGDAVIDLRSYELRRAGERVHVEPQVFDVIRFLAEHAGRVVPKEELLDTIWGTRTMIREPGWGSTLDALFELHRGDAESAMALLAAAPDDPAAWANPRDSRPTELTRSALPVHPLHRSRRRPLRICRCDT